MWISHESFMDLVSRVWMEEANGLALLRLASKLKHLKVSLKVWNKQVFGKTQAHIAELEARVQGLENTRPRTILPALAGLVDPVITDEENHGLCRIPLQQEVYDALCSIPEDSCSGQDGFNSGFFRSCWHFVSNDVTDAVAEFFRGGVLPRFYIASYLVLIPKVENPGSFDKFWPISL
ncbi:uncharacterized protein LOC121262712 [Juglans microcarpa x Juglans regia]|uniref:uncharacterized protein LOC121262712 n=1 Tax=Juglans microcarpa x Juglans regia TaxID=2249226 RepID=UPI001B7F5B8C|nr:uncharacterized protein LOC121262712 [Juglans microcarpa x Juglans regia]